MPCTVHQCLIFICNWLSFIILNQHGHLSPQVLLFLHKDTMCTKLCQFWRLIQIEWVFGLCSVTVTQTILGKMIWSVAHLWVCFLFRLKRSTGTPHSVERVAAGQLPHMWGQSLYILGCLLAEVLSLDPLPYSTYCNYTVYNQIWCQISKHYLWYLCWLSAHVKCQNRVVPVFLSNLCVLSILLHFF